MDLRKFAVDGVRLGDSRETAVKRWGKPVCIQRVHDDGYVILRYRHREIYLLEDRVAQVNFGRKLTGPGGLVLTEGASELEVRGKLGEPDQVREDWTEGLHVGKDKEFAQLLQVLRETDMQDVRYRSGDTELDVGYGKGRVHRFSMRVTRP
ncbi:MAG: hypothetical protein AB1758_29170 [Candidatus Eremiobacterota bacterium]